MGSKPGCCHPGWLRWLIFLLWGLVTVGTVLSVLPTALPPSPSSPASSWLVSLRVLSPCLWSSGLSTSVLSLLLTLPRCCAGLRIFVWLPTCMSGYPVLVEAIRSAIAAIRLAVDGLELALNRLAPSSSNHVDLESQPLPVSHRSWEVLPASFEAPLHSHSECTCSSWFSCSLKLLYRELSRGCCFYSSFAWSPFGIVLPPWWTSRADCPACQESLGSRRLGTSHHRGSCPETTANSQIAYQALCLLGHPWPWH